MSVAEETTAVVGTGSTSDDSLGSDQELSCCGGILCQGSIKSRPDNVGGSATGSPPNYDIAAVAREVLEHLRLGARLPDSALDLGRHRERREEPVGPFISLEGPDARRTRRVLHGSAVHRYEQPDYRQYNDHSMGPSPRKRRARVVERDRTTKGRANNQYEVRERVPSAPAYERRNLQQSYAPRRSQY